MCYNQGAMDDSFRLGPVTLHLGDALDVIPKLSNVGCVITDPPYGIGQARRRGNSPLDVDHGLSREEALALTDEVLGLLPPVLDNGAWVWVFQPSATHLVQAHPVLGVFGLDFRRVVIWAKPGTSVIGHPFPRLNYETILLWTKGRANGAKRPQFVGVQTGVSAKGLKPEWLIERMLALSQPAGAVLDPFCGSTPVVLLTAARMGFQTIGIEKNPDSYKEAIACIASGLKLPKKNPDNYTTCATFGLKPPN